MRYFTFAPFAPALVLLAITAAVAEDPVHPGDSASRAIHLKSGTVIEGRVLDVSGDAIVVEFAGVTGSRGTLKRDDVLPSNFFDLRLESLDPKTADAWLRLAEEAAALGLHTDRMWSLQNAARLDQKRAPDIQKDIDACRNACSEQRLSVAQTFLDAGELDRARKFLKEVMNEYRGCIAVEKAKALAKSIDENLENERAKASKITDERRRLQASQEELQIVRDLQDRGEAALQEGRKLLERPGTAISRFDEAHALFERAWKRLVGFKPPMAHDAGFAKEIDAEAARLRESVRDDLVSVHLELGHAYLTRSSFVKATAHAGEAAALDPESPEVLALRVAIAAARPGGWRR